MTRRARAGAIRRVRAALDPRHFRVRGVAAPTDEEHARPYLWRFWRNIPAPRRCRDLRPQLVWARAGRARRRDYASTRAGCAPIREINDFEGQLARGGA